jgi:hypothetical protein
MRRSFGSQITSSAFRIKANQAALQSQFCLIFSFYISVAAFILKADLCGGAA